MLRSFFLPLSSRLSSLRWGCSPPAGCSSRSSTETVFLRAARSLAHAAPPPSARGRLLAPPPPPAVVLPPDTGDRSGDQKSRCTEPGREKPETPCCYWTPLTPGQVQKYRNETLTRYFQTENIYLYTINNILFILYVCEQVFYILCDIHMCYFHILIGLGDDSLLSFINIYKSCSYNDHICYCCCCTNQ